MLVYMFYLVQITIDKPHVNNPKMRALLFAIPYTINIMGLNLFYDFIFDIGFLNRNTFFHFVTYSVYFQMHSSDSHILTYFSKQNCTFVSIDVSKTVK